MKKSFLTGAAAILLLAVLSFFIACSGGFIDPGAGTGGSGGYGGTDGTGGTGGTGGGGKPALLASNASHSEAIAKLDEIIDYSGTPAAVKSQARNLKPSIDTVTIKSGWTTNIGIGSTTPQAQCVALINGLIDLIP